MSTKDEKLSIARKYIQVSNEHKLEEMWKLYDQNDMVSVSESISNPSLNQTRRSFNEITTAFSKFMIEFAPDIQWEIKDNSFTTDENFSNAKKKGDAVFFSFKRTSKQNPKANGVTGKEWVCINEQGKIYHITVITD